jgi:hypothetical protein
MMEKPRLPMKTKIAAKWMMSIGVFELIWGCFAAVASVAGKVYERYKTELKAGYTSIVCDKRLLCC